VTFSLPRCTRFPFLSLPFPSKLLNVPPPYPSFSHKKYLPWPFRFLERPLLLWRLVWPPILGRRLWWGSFSVDRKAEKATYKVRMYVPYRRRIEEIEKRKKIVRVYRNNITRRASWASCKKADVIYLHTYVPLKNQKSKKRKRTKKNILTAKR